MSCSNASVCYFGFELANTSPSDGSVFVTVLFIVIFLLAVFGNAIFIAAMTRKWSELDLTDKFMVSIAFGDILAAFAIPFVGFLVSSGNSWFLGTGGCRFFAWLGITAITVTCTNGVAMTIDLYYRIIHPQLRELEPRTERGVVIGTWLLAGLPGLFVVSSIIQRDNTCLINWSLQSEVAFMGVMFFLQILIPLTTLTIFLVRIGLSLPWSSSSPDPLDGQRDDNTILVADSNCNHDNSKRALVLLIVNALFYVIVVLYFFVHLWLVLDLEGISTLPSSRSLHDGFLVVLSVKCVANPILYMIFLDRFKTPLKHFFTAKNSGAGSRFLLRYRKARSDTTMSHDYDDTGDNVVLTQREEILDSELAYRSYRDTVAMLP